MKVTCIVAVAKNNVIGNGNEIPWYLPNDLKYFKKTTLNHHIIMGRKCYESIGKPLPKRTNIIVTRDPYYIVSNCLIAHSIEEALQIANNNGEEEAFIIGGGKIYEQTVKLWDKLHITEVDLEIEGDVYFPKIDMSNWSLESREENKPDTKNKFAHSFNVYDRIS